MGAGGRGAGADETKLVPSRQILIGRGEEAGGGGAVGQGLMKPISYLAGRY